MKLSVVRRADLTDALYRELGAFVAARIGMDVELFPLLPGEQRCG